MLKRFKSPYGFIIRNVVGLEPNDFVNQKDPVVSFLDHRIHCEHAGRSDSRGYGILLSRSGREFVYREDRGREEGYLDFPDYTSSIKAFLRRSSQEGALKGADIAKTRRRIEDLLRRNPEAVLLAAKVLGVAVAIEND